eukprot:TRINITY_DN34351_c0_g1_i1.p1 TRINITY_DN34351_c0_g1~~TRINITY_DN34351_c0_g1_i1.p1  ORF type:complete len:645 (-),score=141.87 TRINITY_DN34351_c0_g1_i1:197-2131(-)
MVAVDRQASKDELTMVASAQFRPKTPAGDESTCSDTASVGTREFDSDAGESQDQVVRKSSSGFLGKFGPSKLRQKAESTRLLAERAIAGIAREAEEAKDKAEKAVKLLSTPSKVTDDAESAETRAERAEQELEAIRWERDQLRRERDALRECVGPELAAGIPVTPLADVAPRVKTSSVVEDFQMLVEQLLCRIAELESELKEAKGSGATGSSSGGGGCGCGGYDASAASSAVSVPSSATSSPLGTVETGAFATMTTAASPSGYQSASASFAAMASSNTQVHGMETHGRFGFSLGRGAVRDTKRLHDPVPLLAAVMMSTSGASSESSGARPQQSTGQCQIATRKSLATSTMTKAPPSVVANAVQKMPSPRSDPGSIASVEHEVHVAVTPRPVGGSGITRPHVAGSNVPVKANLGEPNWEKRELITVEVDRTNGGSLGVELHQSREEASLTILMVKQCCLVADWNLQHPFSPVLAGDRIIRVNGEGGSVKELLERLMQNKVLVILVVRGTLEEAARATALLASRRRPAPQPAEAGPAWTRRAEVDDGFQPWGLAPTARFPCAEGHGEGLAFGARRHETTCMFGGKAVPVGGSPVAIDSTGRSGLLVDEQQHVLASVPEEGVAANESVAEKDEREDDPEEEEEEKEE